MRSVDAAGMSAGDVAITAEAGRAPSTGPGPMTDTALLYRGCSSASVRMRWMTPDLYGAFYEETLRLMTAAVEEPDAVVRVFPSRP